MQTSKQHPARSGEKDQRVKDGFQVYGEHQRISGSRQTIGCAGTGDLPDCGPVGATEPQLCGDLLTVTWKEGS